MAGHNMKRHMIDIARKHGRGGSFAIATYFSFGFWFSFHREGDGRDRRPLYTVGSGLRRPMLCNCEERNATKQTSSLKRRIASNNVNETGNHVENTTIRAPSWWVRSLSSLYLCSLPEPRLLTPSDPIFMYSELRRGLKQRLKDEQRLRAFAENEALEARKSGSRDRMKEAHMKMCEIAYGKGVTPQERENFQVRYGCAAWTDEILDCLVELGINGRGIIEIGAGNGQWARAISDRAVATDFKGGYEFIMAFDDMSNLPLNPKVYHKYTQPAHDYFYPRVRKSTSMEEALHLEECRGRVLLIVYPGPGSMALDAVKSYVEGSSISGEERTNHTVVYVGEGRGGANANDAFFDFLQSGEWVLVKTMNVLPAVGGKGYEKLFILKHVGTVTKDTDNDSNEAKKAEQKKV